MTWLDWSLVAAYILVIIYIGYSYAHAASESTEDFFVAGRKLGWFMAGTSMVATTFSADTPLFVAGMTREEGISANWFWWCMAIGQITSVFFFARLWRRTEVVTDLEFLTLRYPDSSLRRFLRVFKVFYDGLLINTMTLAVVLLSITKIMKALIGYEEKVWWSLGPVDFTTTLLMMIFLSLCPLLFTILAGLHGVVTAEVMQFGMAMLGSVTLAGIVFFTLQGEGGQAMGFAERLQQLPDFDGALLGFAPDVSTWNYKTFSFLILLAIGWWGAAPSNGYFVQRMLATRSEKDSMLGLLWFNVAHYILRPWPWIIVGLGSLYYFPELKGALAESAYPNMVNQFLPMGLKGLMVASLFAAFMSTTDTHLNWGTSLVINDWYQAYLKPGQTTAHYLKASRWVMAGLTACTIVIATSLTSILSTFQFIYSILGGLSLLMILRWYWWRVNVAAELTALVSSLTIATLLHFNPEWVRTMITQLTGFVVDAKTDTYPFQLLINTTISSVLWITVAFLTQRSADGHTLSFYRKMRIAGPGWKSIALQTGIHPEPGAFLDNLKGTVITLVFLFSLLLGIGHWIFGHVFWGSACLVLTLVTGYSLKGLLSKMRI